MVIVNLASWVAKRVLAIPRRGFPQSARRFVFDKERGTKTDGVVWLTNPWSSNFPGGVRYEPCPPPLCKWAIDNAGIDPKEFCFLDVGCGKGRPLIVASDYPFQRLIGLDYSKKLCGIARENLIRCGVRNADVVCADATQFAYPSMNTFAFFYHPFSDESILNLTLSRIRGSTAGHRLVVAYVGGGRSSVAKQDWLKKYQENANVMLFRTV
jgi:SAM-dependent methyltransferase